MAIKKEIHTLHVNGEFDVPFVVVQGFDADGDETDTYGSMEEVFGVALGWDAGKARYAVGTDLKEVELTGA